MDDTEKRILGYVISSEGGALMAVIFIAGLILNIDIETIAIIESFIIPLVAGSIAWVRYKYKIKITIPGVPELSTEKEMQYNILPKEAAEMKLPEPENSNLE